MESDGSRRMSRDVENSQSSVPKIKHMSFIKTLNPVHRLDTVVLWPPMCRFGCDLMTRYPAGRHVLVPEADDLGLAVVEPDLRPLVTSTTVVKVTVCQNNIQRL